MKNVLYEIHYNFSWLKFGNCYRLNIEKETDKMYYGSAVCIGNEKDTSRFSLKKSNIEEVAERIENNDIYYRIHLFAEDDNTAYKKAISILHKHLFEKLNRMCNSIKTFVTPKNTHCSVCGHELLFDVGGMMLGSSDYLEDSDMCRSCMEEHCNTTNCLGCTIGDYPNCKFLWLKTSLHLEKEDLLECDKSMGKIKVDKSIFDNFVPNSYINIIFTDSESDEMMSFAMISEDDEGIFMEALV